MIEDEQLRAMFQEEAEEHLQGLEAGLLQIEKDPSDAEVLDGVWREAHSLKGAARMLALNDIELLSHRLEDTLRTCSRTGTPPSQDDIARVYYGIDALRDLVKKETVGTRSKTVISEVIDVLDGKAGVPVAAEKAKDVDDVLQTEATLEEDDTPKQPEPDSAQQATAPSKAQPASIETENQAAGDYRIETVRVNTRRLDTLMSQVGELAVNRTRIGHRLHDMEAVTGLWEQSAMGSRTEIARDEWRALGDSLEKLRSSLYEDYAQLDAATRRLDEGIREMRLLPFEKITALFPRMVRDIAHEEGKEISLRINGGDTGIDKRVLEQIKDPLMHLLRNALHHGIETPEAREASGKPRESIITLSAHRLANNVVIEVSDDGRGLDIESIGQAAVKRGLVSDDELTNMDPVKVQQLVFQPGLTTMNRPTDLAGRGVGLDAVRAGVESLKGKIDLESETGKGCLVRMVLPLTVATLRVMLVLVGGHPYAIPTESVESAIRITPDQVFTIEGREAVMVNGSPVTVENLADLLEFETSPGRENDNFYCVVLQGMGMKIGVLVEEVLDENEVVLKPTGAMLKRVRNVSGSAILGNGQVCMILNPNDLLRSTSRMHTRAARKMVAQQAPSKRNIILLVEDSMITRVQEKRILDGAGYQVVMAVDGVDALEKIADHDVDAVVSDVDMPRMDGVSLTERLRRDKRYAEVPVVLVTTLDSDEDRRRGLEAGANAYITKGTFDQSMLLDTLRRLIG